MDEDLFDRREEQSRRGFVDFRAGETELPESMRACYNRFARKWQGQGKAKDWV